MPVPSELDQRIHKSLNDLQTESDLLLNQHIKMQSTGQGEMLLMQLEHGRSEQDILFSVSVQSLRTRLGNLLDLLATNQRKFSDLKKEISKAHIEQLHGTITAIKRDYEDGLLESVVKLIEANLVADYLTQAEHLLKGNKDGVHTYGPAAVLAGAVLEDGLRRLCARQTPPISTNKPGGYPKTMGTLIDDLKNAGLFNELKAKQLRAWTDIRNAAAHGRFNDFTRSDIEQMIPAIQNFLAEYL